MTKPCTKRMKNRPIYLKILRAAAKTKNGVTIPELRQAIPFLDDLTNERLYYGFVKRMKEYGWLKPLKRLKKKGEITYVFTRMRKLGGHTFTHGPPPRDESRTDGVGNAATIYKITVKGRRFLYKKAEK